MYVCVYIYIYIYIERERGRERERVLTLLFIYDCLTLIITVTFHSLKMSDRQLSNVSFSAAHRLLVAYIIPSGHSFKY